MTLTVAAPTQVPLARDRRPGRLRALRSPGLAVGLVLVVVLLAAGLFAPLVAPYSPTAQGPDALIGPSAAHLLGTDEFGRDLLSRMLYGLRYDLLASLVAVPIGAAVGIVIGLATGLARWLDTVTQRVFDVLLSFTALIMGVTIAAITGAGVFAILLTVGLVNVPLFGRLTRSSVMSQRQRDYVVAAAVVGNGPVRVLVRHVLPNSLSSLIVQAALSMSTAVFIEGSMSFVGIGVRPPAPSLGSLLQGSTNFLSQNPWYAIGPMIAVVLLVVGFQLIADGLTRSLLRR